MILSDGPQQEACVTEQTHGVVVVTCIEAAIHGHALSFDLQLANWWRVHACVCAQVISEYAVLQGQSNWHIAIL